MIEDVLYLREIRGSRSNVFASFNLRHSRAIHSRNERVEWNSLSPIRAPLRPRERFLTLLRIFSLEMTENKRPLLISGTYIIRFFARDAVVAAWLIATTTTMDIFYNERGGPRHERLEIHLLPRETQSNPVGWEEDLALCSSLSFTVN